MKNRRIPSRTRPGVSFVNKACVTFRRDFAVQLPRYACKTLGSLERPLRSKVTVYYPSMRNDLDVAYVYDLLQEFSVVRNDRYIRHKEEIALIDKKNPRVEIEIEEL